MALQGKCPEVIKDKSSSASRKTHFMPGIKKKSNGQWKPLYPHRKECLISPPPHSHPLHPPSIDSNFHHCASWECSHRPLSTTHSPVAMVISGYMENTQANIKIKHNHSLSRTGWYSIQVTGLTLSYRAVTCVAGMCWMAHCFSRSQMTMRPRP